MSELSPQAQAVLAAARHQDSPSAAVRERGWTELQARIESLESSASGDGSYREIERRSRWSTLLFYGQCAAISIGIGMAGVVAILGIRAGMRGVMTSGTTHSVQAQRTVDANHGDKMAVTRKGHSPQQRVAISDDTTVTAPVGLPVESAPVQQPPPPPARPSAVPSRLPDSISSIQADIALLRAAKVTNDPQRAWALLREHEERYPASTFAIERHVLQIEALCRLGENKRSLALAQEFLRQHHESAFTARVRKGCPSP